MSIYKSEDIKRYKDGSIDYNYYSLKAQDARNKEIDALLKMFWNALNQRTRTLKRIKKTRQPVYRKVGSADVTKLNNSSSKSLIFE